ncbi:hypothetical protein M404DRAFT_36113 [Pisolithus tinctorius Marx 270]|uniref:Uncharacterized protein n=1 Tax=Pisolithus tinctorius Marx 270 TaxID=870435 RepID=A0A0C3J6W3_PISTI|nr:hypothetical protein M404DRAFT_36113 [Pisolithus tinctorius Marx 270]
MSFQLNTQSNSTTSEPETQALITKLHALRHMASTSHHDTSIEPSLERNDRMTTITYIGSPDSITFTPEIQAPTADSQCQHTFILPHDSDSELNNTTITDIGRYEHDNDFTSAIGFQHDISQFILDNLAHLFKEDAYGIPETQPTILDPSLPQLPPWLPEGKYHQAKSSGTRWMRKRSPL